MSVGPQRDSANAVIRILYPSLRFFLPPRCFYVVLQPMRNRIYLLLSFWAQQNKCLIKIDRLAGTKSNFCILNHGLQPTEHAAVLVIMPKFQIRSANAKNKQIFAYIFCRFFIKLLQFQLQSWYNQLSYVDILCVWKQKINSVDTTEPDQDIPAAGSVPCRWSEDRCALC